MAAEPIIGHAQHYPWGDGIFIPEFLGVPGDDLPWAELWLGTHPHGPSTLPGGNPLADRAGELPFLLKLLAAGRPLSLQAHPGAADADRGHRAGIFDDPNAKPELLVALTPFVALVGFRPADATLALLTSLGLDDLRRTLERHGHLAVLEDLLRGRLDVSSLVAACRADPRPEARWVVELAEAYPGDGCVVAPILLNLVFLQPGQALRVDSGTLHAYLTGAGIELMAPSDNVVRAGLTTKAIDVDLLLSIVDRAPHPDPVLPAADCYELPAAALTLSVIPAGTAHRATGHELVIDLGGGTWYLPPGEVATFGHTAYAAAARIG